MCRSQLAVKLVQPAARGFTTVIVSSVVNLVLPCYRRRIFTAASRNRRHVAWFPVVGTDKLFFCKLLANGKEPLPCDSNATFI